MLRLKEALQIKRRGRDHDKRECPLTLAASLNILTCRWQDTASGAWVVAEQVFGDQSEVKAFKLGNSVDVRRVVQFVEHVSPAPGNSFLVHE